MKWIRLVSGNNRCGFLLLLAGLVLLLSAVPATGKLAVDFNPHLDFSKFKTFAFIGGVEQLVRMQLNPDQLNNRIHGAVSRELTAKGLREVKPEENPDLVVRYWVNSQKSVDVAGAPTGVCTARTTVITGVSSTTRWILTPTTRAPSALN